MNTSMDTALEGLATAAAHPGLAGLEERVLCAISCEPARIAGIGATIGAAAFALALGVVSNVVPTGMATAAPALSPFGAPSPLAPSTLLLTAE